MNLNYEMKAEELMAELEANDYKLTTTPIVVDLVATENGNEDYVLMFVAAEVTFANTNTGKLSKAQLRMKGWTERTMVARSMEVVSQAWIDEEEIEIGDELEGMKLKVLESTEKFYNKQTARISADTQQPRLTDDEEGNEYYQTTVLVDEEEFDGHELLKTLKYEDWFAKYQPEEEENAGEQASKGVEEVKKPTNKSKAKHTTRKKVTA